jgi:hypothetical protein
MKRHYRYGIWNNWLKAFVLRDTGIRWGMKSAKEAGSSNLWQTACLKGGYTIKRFEANANEI